MSKLLREDHGLIQVHKTCIDMCAIWRPTPCHDIGVDGQIEFLEEGDHATSTGKIIAIQVKSGPSYFKSQTENHIKFYALTKHLRYWRSLNLPTLLVLHNPDTQFTVYTEVKSQLDSDRLILVPKANRFDESTRLTLLEICGRDDDPRRLLSKLKSVALAIDHEKSISGIEFLLSCLAPSHEYFELMMARLKTMLELGFEDDFIGIGRDTYDFIHRCSMLCMSAGITEPFDDEFDNQWYEMKLVPAITVLLTPFGKLVADYLVKHASEFISTRTFAHQQFGNERDIAINIEQSCQRIGDYIDNKDTLYDYPR
jgi:hypothetical protein